jgi:hypothetical protein
MNPHVTRAAEVEAAFLAGAESNLEQGKGTHVPGTRWDWHTQTQEERIRDLLAARGRYDRGLLRVLPKNTTRVLTGMQPRLLFGERRAGVAMASVLTPSEHLLDEETPPPPVNLTMLLAHVKTLTAGADVPHLIGVCSPSGFTDDAKRGGLELPNVTLVLIEPRADGGWKVTPATASATPAECKLFDPEATTTKVHRVREEVERQGVELLTGGMSASAVGKRMGLPTKLVATAFEQLTESDPELRVSRQRDDVLLYRGAPARIEEDAMSMVDWVRQLFRGEGNEARKINALSERRAKLVQRRDRMYADVGQLETRESELLKQGRETTSPSVKRRVASQIKQLRDDMDRQNATARLIGQQVDVISTHIHNLTLIQHGQVAELPSSEEMTEDAVRAEEMIEQLSANVQLAGSLGVGVGAATSSAKELAILKELEAPATTEKVAAAEGKPETGPPEPKQRERPQPEAG